MKEKLGKIYSFLFAILCFAIPFSQLGEAIPNIAIIPVIGVFPFIFNFKEFKSQFDNSIFIFLSILLVILIETTIFLRWEDFKFFTKLLIIPGMYVLSIPIKNKTHSLIGFILGAIVLMLVSYFRIIGYGFSNENFNFSVGQFINDILLGDRPYVGFTYVLGIVLSLYLYFRIKERWIKTLLIIFIILFLSLIFIISARLSLFSLFVIVFLSFFYTKKWKIVLLFTVGLIFSFFFLIKFNPNFIDRFYAGFDQKTYTLEKALIMEPRYHIWDCSAKIAKEDNVIWKGVGFQKTIDKLVDCFQTHDKFKSEEHREYFINSRFNTHNQFICFFLSSGFLVLILFLGFFIHSLIKVKKSYFATALLLSLFLFCTVENVLSRQMGCLLFGFVWSISYYFTLNANKSSKIKGDETDSNSHN